VVAISSTGISDFGRDIPLAMVPLYHWLLAVPHADKKAMEVALSEGVMSASLGGFVVIRPSFLTDGAVKGVADVKVGVESPNGVESLAVGYTISRGDIGNWIFEENTAYNPPSPSSSPPHPPASQSEHYSAPSHNPAAPAAPAQRPAPADTAAETPQLPPPAPAAKACTHYR
ncbi:hypothetical protein V494_07909, partial [Pseudogymnoascus sp. VKM F-4513 (FW-928)]